MGSTGRATAARIEGYIEQTRLSRRPATMVGVEAVLREFAGWLTAQAREVGAVSNRRRAHIERYKRHLADRPAWRAAKLSKIGLAEPLGTLRVCPGRLGEWTARTPRPGVLMSVGRYPASR